MIRCPTCDFSGVPGERRCPICRNPFPGRSAAGPEAAPSLAAADRSSTGFLIVGGVAIALLSVCLVLLFGGGESDLRPQSKTAVAAPRLEARPVTDAPPAAAPPPLPVASDASAGPMDRLMAAADEKLARAKLLYDEGQAVGSQKLLNEAGFSAEDAQRTYQLLADAYEGFRLEEIRDKLTQANRLVTLIGDAKKSAPKPVPMPAPAPAPGSDPAPTPLATAAPANPSVVDASPPPPPPAPALPPAGAARHAGGWAAAVEQFKEYVSFPSSDKVEPARSAALEAAANAREVRPLLTAIAAILCDKDRQVWFERSDERKAFEELFRKHDPSKFDAMTPEKLEEALADIAAGKGLPKGEGGFLQLWGCAHLARLAMLGASNAALKKWLAKFGLAEERSSGEWICGTPVGLAMNSFREVSSLAEAEKALKKAKVAKDPEFATYAALAQLRLWDAIRDPKEKMTVLLAMEKLFRTARPLPEFADLFRHVAGTLRERMPCGTCQGTGSIDCDSCEEGRRLEECRMCRGSGKTETFRGQPQPCWVCNGSGKTAMGGRCRECRGSGTLACKPCGGEPWAAPKLSELVSLAPCELCQGRGSVLDPIQVACPLCVGLGQIPSKP